MNWRFIGIVAFIVICIGVIVGVELARQGEAIADAGPGHSAAVAPPARPEAAPRTFTFCHTGGGRNCVVDGDTIWMDGQNIRLLGIDAPETHEWRCLEEKALGERATRRLIALVNSGAVGAHREGRDRDAYGRALRVVTVDGRDVGDVLIAEGLARPYGRGRRSWCD